MSSLDSLACPLHTTYSHIFTLTGAINVQTDAALCTRQTHLLTRHVAYDFVVYASCGIYVNVSTRPQDVDVCDYIVSYVCMYIARVSHTGPSS